MDFFALPLGPSPLLDRNPRKFAITLAGATLAAAIGLLLQPSLGLAGAYAPLFLAVFLATWFGGLWNALLSQVWGGGTILLFARPTLRSPLTVNDVAALCLFLVTAKLLMFLLLSIRWNFTLRSHSRRLEAIAEATHDSLWEWDLASGHVWRAGKLSLLFGVSPTEVEPTINWWLGRVHPDESERVWKSLRSAIDGEQVKWKQEYRLRHAAGYYVIVSDQAVIVRDRAGRATKVLGGTVDVSAQRRTEERLVHNAFHDPLTGLPNRELFLDRLDRSLVQYRESRGAYALAVLFMDVDRFKVINDSLGHAVGDELLVAITGRLKRHLRSGDTAARFGGDEFTMLLDTLEETADALRIAERIQHSLAVPFSVGAQQVTVSGSIGVAFATRDTERPEEVVRQADLAMYRAKAGGRARSQLFEPSFDTHARTLLQRESELRQSFHDHSLQLYYQPIVSLDTARTVSFEALLRWDHPVRGLVMPSEILPLSDEAGLSIQLGKWVLNESCRQLSRWRQAHLAPQSLTISVNLSGKELMRPTLLDEVSRLLDEYELEGSCLLIELTETTIMEGDALAIRTLTRLRDMGVVLALDDFGRGHSSLGRLQDFPISMMKIDSSFVSQIGGPKQKILDAIMALGHELKIEVTAEGVETPEQLSYLVGCGIARAQGRLFADALRVSDVTQLLSQTQHWPAIHANPVRVARMGAR